MTWVYNQLKYGIGVYSIVMSYSTENLDQFPWVPIYQVGKIEYLLLRVLRKLGFSYRRPSTVHESITRNHNISVIHSHFGDKGWYDLILAEKHNLKHIVTFYGYDMSLLPAEKPIWKTRYKELFNKVDLILCEGPHMAQGIVSLGCPKSKVRILRLGIEVEKIPYIPRETIKDKPINILIAGTFREKKGIPYALSAIGKVRNYYPNLQVTIIGDSSGTARENKEKQKILDAIRTNNLESITTLLGFQSYTRLMEESYKHHIFISPSVTSSDGDTEGGAPVTIIEMAATGMPIISSNHCDIPQIIRNGESGFLAEERDIDGLATNLLWLINHTDSWEKFTKSARANIEQKFNIKNQAEKLAAIYREISDS